MKMKNNYTLKTLLSIILVFAFYTQIDAQIRIVRLDPATNTVALKNFGSTTEPIGSLWFCNFPDYALVSSMTSTANLAAGASVTFTSTINFDVADGEFGLYTVSSFSNPTFMIDYMQWGTAGHTREGVANSAGVWTTGTFITVAPPYEFNGNGTNFGVNFWQTSLSINDIELNNEFTVSPNPTNSDLNLRFNSTISEGNINIHDISGKLIYSRKVGNTNSETINASEWMQGIYLVTISTNSKTQTKRFVKQ